MRQRLARIGSRCCQKEERRANQLESIAGDGVAAVNEHQGLARNARQARGDALIDRIGNVIGFTEAIFFRHHGKKLFRIDYGYRLGAAKIGRFRKTGFRPAPVKVRLVVLNKIDERALAAEMARAIALHRNGEFGRPPCGREKYVVGAQIEPAALALIGVDDDGLFRVLAGGVGDRLVAGQRRIGFGFDIRVGHDDAPVEVVAEFVEKRGEELHRRGDRRRRSAAD